MTTDSPGDPPRNQRGQERGPEPSARLRNGHNGRDRNHNGGADQRRYAEESRTPRRRDERHRRDDDDRDDLQKNADGRRGFLQSPAFKIILAVILIAALVGAVIWWRIARQYEDTDDAFIDTHIVHIAPRVAGQVTQVFVNDNQDVLAGAPLIELDPADARAHLTQMEAQETQAKTQYQQALATIAGTRAQTENAQRDLARYRLLARTAPEAVAQQQVDQATATAKNAVAQQEAAEAQAAGALAQTKVYEAEIAAARLTLDYNRALAPIDGHVVQRTVAVGNYVAAGQEVMTIVPRQVWVTANFKETQLALVRVGQPVSVRVDACGNEPIDGHVDSIQRGAGQAFGILPPENATGNYVKVVQRVPVKIVLDRIPDNCPLGPGMSVEPRIKVR